MASLPAFVAEVNALAEVITLQAVTCDTASQTVGVTAWESGTNYSAGAVRWDTINFLTYRRSTAGAGTTRPGLDPDNWVLLTGLGDVRTVGDQIVGGVKSFTSQVRLANGTAAVPSLTFSSETGQNTGLYWGGDGIMAFANDGVKSGEILANGTLVMAGNVTAYSDARLKTGLQRIDGALDKVQTLTGYTYQRLDTGERQTGLVAQEVEEVLPEAVVRGEEFLSVAYGNMMGLMVEAIKELRAEIASLKKAA